MALDIFTLCLQNSITKCSQQLGKKTTSNPDIIKTIKKTHSKKKNIPAQNFDYISFTYFVSETLTKKKNFIKRHNRLLLVVFLALFKRITWAKLFHYNYKSVLSNVLPKT